MALTDKQQKDAALDGIAIATAALTYRGGDSRDDEAYVRELKQLFDGKTIMEVILMVASMGDLTQQMIRALADDRGADPYELLQELALNVRRRADEMFPEE